MLSVFYKFGTAAITACVLSSCLYTSQHFNTGETLEPGQTQFTMGFGFQKVYSCNSWSEDDICRDLPPDREDEYERIYGPYETETAPLLSIDYRVGARKRWGPFPGAEIGWHIEALTLPITLEFRGTLALPGLDSSKYHHSLSLGWGIGFWADNTFFLEYAISRSYAKHRLFAGTRGIFLATLPFEVMENDPVEPFIHNRRLAGQLFSGFLINIPDIVIIPDVIIPQVIFSVPKLAVGEEVFDNDLIGWIDFKWNIGMGWRF